MNDKLREALVELSPGWPASQVGLCPDLGMSSMQPPVKRPFSQVNVFSADP